MNIHLALIGLILFGGVIGFFIGYLCGIIHEDKIYNKLSKLEDWKKGEKDERRKENGISY